MIKCDELSKEKSADDQFMCYQNQGYEDEESCKPIQETDDQTRSEDGSESDVSKCNEESQEKKEGHEESESDVTKDADKAQEEKPVDQPESIDVLL